MTTQHKNSVLDHTADKPWRDGALGYENVEMTGDDGKRHLHCAEDAIWAAFSGEWPQPGYRVGFRDGNPRNRSFENLVLLSPEETEEIDKAAAPRMEEQLELTLPSEFTADGYR